MLQRFNNLQVFIVKCICYDDVLVKSTTCNIPTICWERYSTDLCFMELLMRDALTHVQVPKGNWTIVMAYSSLANTKWKLLIGIFITKCLWRAQADLVHFWELRPVHFINKLLAPNVPDLDSLIGTNWYCKRTIIWCFDWKDVTWMTLEVSHILTSLGVPDLNVFFHQTTRKENSWVDGVKANCSNNCSMALQSHLLCFLLPGFLVFVLVFKIRSDKDLNHLVVGASSN